MALTYRYFLKVGSIEFYVEGDENYIEKERLLFIESTLPLLLSSSRLLEKQNVVELTQGATAPQTKMQPELTPDVDSATSLSINEWLNKFGGATQIDKALLLIKHACENGKLQDVGIVELRDLFREARLKPPVNPTDVLNKLINKGYIQKSTGRSKKYVITRSGEDYLANYQTKVKKDSGMSTRPKKPNVAKSSRYGSLTRDQLNLDKYPLINNLKDFKSKLILTMYIVREQEFGSEFSTADCIFLLTDLMGEKASKGQVDGIFDRNPNWFSKSPDPLKKGYQVKKLLNPAIRFAEEIIQK